MLKFWSWIRGDGATKNDGNPRRLESGLDFFASRIPITTGRKYFTIHSIGSKPRLRTNNNIRFNASNHSIVAINYIGSRPSFCCEFGYAISQGCGAQTIVFVCAVLSSAVICPALGKFHDHVITVLIALGAACLVGDAAFHLLPHALNPAFNFEHGGSTNPDGANLVLWRSSLVICSIYFFYLFHLFFCAMEGGHTHSHCSTPEAQESIHLIQCESQSKSEDSESKTNKALIGMMLLGEALHTTADGLAVGAAFSKSAGDGLSTSLAVLFHEIPHAVGTFAIFVSSGVSMRRALGLLSFCYVCSYAGVVTGALLGASLNLTAWIFAVIAGMFLYIALAEMIPEMFSAITLRTSDRRYFVLLQNVGLLIGFTIMMLLARFEDKIRNSLQ